jgi:hypothetical protein
MLRIFADWSHLKAFQVYRNRQGNSRRVTGPDIPAPDLPELIDISAGKVSWALAGQVANTTITESSSGFNFRFS